MITLGEVMTVLAKIRRWWVPLLAGLSVLLLLLLWFSPGERTLGQSVKLVYLHGVLVRTAVVLFAVSLLVNLGAMVTGKLTQKMVRSRLYVN
jgi:hypothetical protein